MLGHECLSGLKHNFCGNACRKSRKQGIPSKNACRKMDDFYNKLAVIANDIYKT